MQIAAYADEETLAIFLTGPYGKMAKILGKKKIMLLNVSSLTLAGIYFTLVCKYMPQSAKHGLTV